MRFDFKISTFVSTISYAFSTLTLGFSKVRAVVSTSILSFENKYIQEQFSWHISLSVSSPNHFFGKWPDFIPPHTHMDIWITHIFIYWQKLPTFSHVLRIL